MEIGEKIVKIAVVGPESTGKSTISQLLAEHYNTVWVPEYAREYCSRLTEPCSWQDEINMFRGQLQLEESLATQANKLLICDTTFLTVKIWSDYMFGKTPEEVLEMLPQHTYDLYLLMDIDLPWEDDPLRDFPHLRGYFMEIWHNELAALHARYTVISGSTNERLQNAVQAVNNYLNII
ncbi:AAA family ATPase [Arcticibacter sp. MXS-1]|uniref:AAA family ATPase n=1 Tax=Arcticibacter sp. MXS-1 TaxID=3341726 RepID=UPI0035A8F048